MNTPPFNNGVVPMPEKHNSTSMKTSANVLYDNGTHRIEVDKNKLNYVVQASQGQVIAYYGYHQRGLVHAVQKVAELATLEQLHGLNVLNSLEAVATSLQQSSDFVERLCEEMGAYSNT